MDDGKKIKTGNYDCDAAFSQNLGIDKNSLPGQKIILLIVKKAVRTGLQFINRFNQNQASQDYFKSFKIPKQIQHTLQQIFKIKEVEINLFGGNPELHPKILTIIAKL